jgi:hypothetical protein
MEFKKNAITEYAGLERLDVTLDKYKHEVLIRLHSDCMLIDHTASTDPNSEQHVMFYKSFGLCLLSGFFPLFFFLFFSDTRSLLLLGTLSLGAVYFHSVLHKHFLLVDTSCLSLEIICSQFLLIFFDTSGEQNLTAAFATGIIWACMSSCYKMFFATSKTTTTTLNPVPYILLLIFTLTHVWVLPMAKTTQINGFLAMIRALSYIVVTVLDVYVVTACKDLNWTACARIAVSFKLHGYILFSCNTIQTLCFLFSSFITETALWVIAQKRDTFGRNGATENDNTKNHHTTVQVHGTHGVQLNHKRLKIPTGLLHTASLPLIRSEVQSFTNASKHDSNKLFSPQPVSTSLSSVPPACSQHTISLEDAFQRALAQNSDKKL